MATTSTLPARAAAATWADPRSFAATLLCLFHDLYFDPDAPSGRNCYTWHPGTIALEIRDDSGVELPRASFDRLMMAICLVRSDAFYRNAPTFVQACTVLAGGLFDPAVFDVADAAACAWGITEALLISPPEPDDHAPFSAEIRAYLGKVLDREGIINPPDILGLAERPGDPAGRVAVEYADDPDLLAAIRAADAEKGRAIAGVVRDNMALLAQQLAGLRLARGDAAGLAEQISKHVR